MADTRSTPLFAIGLFFGILVGVFLTILLGTDATDETFEDYERRKAQEQGGGARRPDPGRTRNPGGDGHGQDGHGGGRRNPRVQMAKIHFMKKFVKALTALPQNAHAASDYEVLLKDPKNPIVCSDCHKDSTLDFNKMAQADPGNSPLVQQLRHDPNFMVPLMTKWVARLNDWHGKRLAKPVTCTSCHAVDPKDKWEVYPVLMKSFVSALKTKPTNKNPAENWKPLLRDPATKSMLCAYCHPNTGERMEEFLDQILARFGDEPPKKYAGNKGFMVNIMEDWVERANDKLKGVLVKPLVCLDCHETDPRR